MEKQKDPNKVKQGKRNKAQGAAFELRVRKDLEEKGWIVSKWQNQVELNGQKIGKQKGCGKIFKKYTYKCGTYHNQEGYDYTTLCPKCKEAKLIPAKTKWAGPGRPMVLGSGFPDFVAFKTTWSHPVLTLELPNKETENILAFSVIGVESKMTGELNKLEKQKCRWLLDNGIFSQILVASKQKIKNRIHVKYEDFTKKYYRFIK